MAQTGYTPILIYSSSAGGNAPAAGNLTNSTLGSELAINITDGKLFYKDNANAIQVIGWKTTPTTAGGTGLTSYTAGDLLYYATGSALSKLAIGTNGQILKSTGSAPAWENVSALAVTSISFGTTGLTPSTVTQGAVTVAGTLVAANGGTGQSSYTVGDILYASGSTTLSKLADVATGNALISGGVGVAPSWGKIGLTTHVSGTLPTANGGTNLTSFTANSILYASSTSALATSSNFTWNGATINATVASGTSRLQLVTQSAGVNLLLDVTGTTCEVGSPNGVPLLFKTSATDRGRFDTSGNLKIENGNLIIGTSGKGIDFSATPGTGTSELFADYEEGTWTGTISVNNFSGTTPTTLNGTYTKIGRTVQITFLLFAGGSSFDIGAGVRSEITGLPYTIGSTIAFSVAGTTGVYGDARASSTTITMESIASSAAMFMQFTYQV
jgi:hypothetical protein